MREIEKCADSVWLIKDFISESERELLLAYANDPTTDWSGGDWAIPYWKDRITKTPDNLYLPIKERALALFRSYDRTYGFHTISRYTTGQSMGTHADDIKEKTIKYGIVLYLNDDYEGGEISYPNLGLTIKPKAGWLVIHKGSEPHEVLQVTSGNTRYVMQEFVHGSDDKPAILIENEEIAPPKLLERDGSCAICPNDWRFWYAYHAGKEVGKGNQMVLPIIYNAEIPDDIPAQLRKNADNSNYQFIYKDELIAIFDEIDKDNNTHLIVVPIQHIDRLNINHNPYLIKVIYCAGNMIMKLAKLREIYIAISSKEYDYMPHSHYHLHSKTSVDLNKLRELLTPKFYERSEFY